MTSTRDEYVQAIRELEAAYVADRLSYIDINRRSKDFWALQPPRSWPNTPDFAPWQRARERLLAAETRVVELLRRRCVEIVARRKQRQALRKLACEPYVEQTVETVPDDLRISNFLSLQQFEPPQIAPFLRVH
ncbi:MAG: hypothetical protein JSS56_22045 [Proteobacteria bacterium]|nr:hypothetical protein [Pseudomonadota bacterium]